MKKYKLIITTTILGFAIPTLGIANEFSADAGILVNKIDYGDLFNTGDDIKENNTAIGIQAFFKPINTEGPRAEAIFLSKTSNLYAIIGQGDFGTSSFKLDTDTTGIGASIFANQNLAITLNYSAVDIEILGDGSDTNIGISYYTDEDTAVSFTLGKLETLASSDDTNSFSLQAYTLLDHNNVKASLNSLIQINQTDDFDWNDFSINYTYYSNDTTGLLIGASTSTGDVEDYFEFEIGASKYFEGDLYIEGTFAITNNDISDDVTSFVFVLGKRF